MIDAPELLDDFSRACAEQGMAVVDIEHGRALAPHVPPSLPSGKGAVYVFSLSGRWGARSPAGPNRVLKVGKVGANSNPRFQYQHYNPRSAMSTLASSLLANRVLWPYLGNPNISETTIGVWMKQHLDRDHFFVAAAEADVRSMLEVYLRARLGPVFEGS